MNYNFRIFDYNKNLLPNDYLKEKEENVLTIEEARLKTGDSIGYPAWCLLYYFLMCSLDRKKYNNIIEIGTNFGFSTIILAQALKDSKSEGKIYTIEKEKSYYNKAKENIEKAKLGDYVNLINDKSLNFLKTVNFKVSFVFLDGSHEKSIVFNEFKLLFSHLTNSALVCFDNTAERIKNERVFGALKKIKRHYKGNLINFKSCSWSTPGITIWQK